MDYGSVPTPPATDARYEALTGGRSNRIVLYLAKRRLGYNPDEWEALPWHWQRLYVEGFIAEGKANSGEPDDEEVVDPVTASSSQLSNMGLTVIRGGGV